MTEISWWFVALFFIIVIIFYAKNITLICLRERTTWEDKKSVAPKKKVRR